MIDGTEGAPAPGQDPAAPAPRATVTDAPAPADTRSAVERASDEARARIAAGGSAIESEPARKTPARDEQGKFTDQPRRRLPEPKPGETPVDPAQGAEPEGGPAAGEPEGAAPEGEEPKPGVEAVDGQPEPDGDEEGGEPEFVEIELPGRRDGEAVKFKFAPDEAEDIQRLVNGYKRAEVVQQERAKIEARAAEIEDWQEEVELDPASAVARTLRNDPAAMEQLALTILADPNVWQRVKDRVLRWDEPLQFELDAAKLQVAAANRREEVREMAAERRVVSRNLAQVQAAVGALIPSDKLSEDQATTFYRDAMRDLKEHAERQNLLTLDPRDIPLILATSGRLRAYGIDAVKAAEIVQEALSGTRREAKPGGSKPPSKTPAPPVGSPPPAKRGKDFVAGAQRRKVAAATPGAGAGSPSTAVTPPPGQSIEERTAWHRQQTAKGRTLTR